MYNGICIVHARYEGKKSSKSNNRSESQSDYDLHKNVAITKSVVPWDRNRKPDTLESFEGLLASYEEMSEKKVDGKQKSVKTKKPIDVIDVTDDFLIDF